MIMATWGGIVSAKSLPATEKKLPHLWGFIAMGALGVILIGAIGVHNYSTQKENARVQEKMQADLATARRDATDTKTKLDDSRLTQEFMKGQLSGLSLMVGKINETGAVGNKQMASALSAISRKASEAQDNRSALERMSNAALRSKVLEFSKTMLEVTAKYDAMGSANTDAMMTQISRTKDEKERSALFIRMTDTSTRLYNQFKLEFGRDYLAQAILYRDEFIRRLGPQPPPRGEEGPTAFDGTFVNTMSAYGTAVYLQKLAYKLPPQ